MRFNEQKTTDRRSGSKRLPAWLLGLGLALSLAMGSCASVRYAPFGATEALWGREAAMEHGAAALPGKDAYIFSIRESGVPPSPSGGSAKGGGGCGCQ